MSLVKRFLLNPRTIVAVASSMALVLGTALVLEGAVDTQRIRARFEEAVREKTGRDVAISGNISVSLLPRPIVTIPRIDIRDEAGMSPSLRAESVRLGISFASIFSDAPEIHTVIIDRPTLELMRPKNQGVKWDWIDNRLLSSLGLDTSGQGGAPMRYAVNEGIVVYTDSNSGKAFSVENINVIGSSGADAIMAGSFRALGKDISLELSRSAASDKPLSLLLYQDNKNTLEWQGSVDLSGEDALLDGKVKLALFDALEWLAPAGKTVDAKRLPFAVALEAKWQQRGSAVTLPEATLTAMQSVGTGALNFDWQDEPKIGIDMAFASLDYDQWKQLFDDVIARQSAREVSAAELYSDKESQENPLPAGINIALNITADSFKVATQSWSKMQMHAELDAAAITMHQFVIALPGESTLSLFGIVSHQIGKGMRFEGSMETRGKNLRDMLMVFEESARDLPQDGFEEFSARANIYVSSEQVRLSEADVKISELSLGGGLAAYFDSNPRVEADVRLRNIDFDYFRNVWRESQQQAGKNDAFLKFDKGMNFSWLNRLQTNVDFKVNVDGFTFLERAGNFASFRLYAQPGEFSVSNIRLLYPNEVLEGNLNLNATGEKPYISALLNTSQLDTGYFHVSEPAPLASPEKAPVQWPQELLDMSWMEGWNGAFDVSIGKLMHRDMSFDNVKLRLQLENETLAIQSLSFGYWDGRCDITGTLIGGVVPGLSINFTFYNAILERAMHALIARDNITGRMSVSGTLATSGVNLLSWVSQAEAKVAFAGRGVRIDGFNIQSVVDVVNVSRIVSDVFNNVNLALPKGSSEFAIDGNINIKNGIARTPGITLKTNAIAGNLIGEVKLVPWTMELISLFQFPMLSSDTIPTMTVRVAGPIQSPEMQVDTASLEAFVAKNITGGGTRP